MIVRITQGHWLTVDGKQVFIITRATIEPNSDPTDIQLRGVDEAYFSNYSLNPAPPIEEIEEAQWLPE